MKTHLPIALLIALLPTGPLPAYDAGDLDNEWTTSLELPAATAGGAPRDTILGTVRDHIHGVLERRDVPPGLADRHRDQVTVFRKYPALSEPRPVLTEEGQISRYLVGFEMGDRIGGFFSVTADGARLCGELAWTGDLDPLWTVPRSIWEQAGAVNDVPDLAELVTPSDTFTMGLPVEPAQHPDWVFVEGSLDELPHKCQEERKEWLERLNVEHRLETPLKAFLGRRTGTSKCMSVAASYLADWWSDRVGRRLPTYVNGVGGQKEYGHDPRLIESLFYRRAQDESSIFHWEFQTAPFARDRITGERVPFSMRSYARILAESDAMEFADHLVPSVTYRIDDNAFAMDQAPLFLYKRASYDEDALARALETWGPLLAQHTSRDKKGRPKRFVGIHGVVLVGHGRLDGRKVFVYRESFGTNTREYLEDSFGGPRYRAFSLPFLYQAIAFPHRLRVTARARTGADRRARLSIDVTTDRGHDRVDPDRWRVQLDGVAVPVVPRRIDTGRYELDLEVPDDSPTAQVTLVAARRYFADRDGNGAFSATLPISIGYESASDDPEPVLEAPSPEEALASWAEEVAGEVRTMVEEGRGAEARRTIADLVSRVPGMRRPLLAKLVELYDGDPGQVPGELGL